MSGTKYRAGLPGDYAVRTGGGGAMITEILRLLLMVFALVGYGGAGASLAVRRYRLLADGERDFGMLAVAGMLFVFGALCTSVSLGVAGVPAFGGVVAWAGYVFMAQHMGMFRIETGRRPPAEQEPTEEPRRAK
ncbi:MAG: hypothetical protein HY703_00995 [Gemmatimonadetes bacterium]|nr:hypothetical protein [Gemmatimonadota bacterium]